MSKYDPLSRLLAGYKVPDVQFTFADVERLLQFSLPTSARSYPAWWSNHAGNHVQARSWMKEGWKVWEVDLTRERVRFVKQGHDPQDSSRGVGDTPQASFELDTNLLSPAGSRLLRDYCAEANGDFKAALARAVHEAAVARRHRILEAFPHTGEMTGLDSVDLIREDRDAR